MSRRALRRDLRTTNAAGVKLNEAVAVTSRRRLRGPRLLSGTLVVLVVGGLLGWAARTVFPYDQTVDANAARFAVVDVVHGDVGRTISLNASAAWSGGQTLVPRSSGTVTSVRVDGATTVDVGDVLYDVNLQPVRVAEGSVPAFRDLRRGDRGEDVAQLQQMLRTLGFRTEAVDGVFGSKTETEVARWQKASEVDATGFVVLGSLLFVPRLPAPVALGAGIREGVVLSGDGLSVPDEPGNEGWPTNAVKVLPRYPAFGIDLPENQAALVQAGMRVTLGYGKYRWKARLGRIGTASADGSRRAELIPLEGRSSICRKRCNKVPLDGSGAITADIQIIPPVSGPMIPTTALVVADSGAPAVRMADGRSTTVTVTATAGGRSIVEGVNIGDQIRVPGGG